MNATRRPVLELATDQYVCGRCGILRRWNPSRKKPALCGDCQTVLRYLDKPERNWEEEPFDLLETTPPAGDLDPMPVLHCLNRADAVMVKRNMVHGDHYELHRCTCPKGAPDE